MKIEYRFVNGEKASIDVSDDFEKIILELDRNLYNNNHTETRRHMSLDALEEDKIMLKDIGLDLEDQVLNRADSKTLYKAISKLKSDEQELIHNLYLSDHPITQKEYAERLGITSSTLRKRVERLKSKLSHLVKTDR